jgi:hypothetical protein
MAEHFGRRRDLIREAIAKRHHPHRRIRFESLKCRTGAAAATADQADAESLVTGREQSTRRQRADGGARGSNGAAEERSS